MGIPPDGPPPSALYGVRYSYDWQRTWRYVIVQPSVKNVGLAAATFSNKRGLEVRPGVARLMAITGLSRPSVIDALATLRYLGFLRRRFCGQGSDSRKADEYQLCLPRSIDHLPMIESKSGRVPSFLELSPMAQQTAVRLGAVGKLRKGTGQVSEPTSQLRQPPLVSSVDHWWLAQLTTPTHLSTQVITIPIDTIGPMLAQGGASMTSTRKTTATSTSAITPKI